MMNQAQDNNNKCDNNNNNKCDNNNNINNINNNIMDLQMVNYPYQIYQNNNMEKLQQNAMI